MRAWGIRLGQLVAGALVLWSLAYILILRPALSGETDGQGWHRKQPAARARSDGGVSRRQSDDDDDGGAPLACLLRRDELRPLLEAARAAAHDLRALADTSAAAAAAGGGGGRSTLELDELELRSPEAAETLSALRSELDSLRSQASALRRRSAIEPDERGDGASPPRREESGELQRDLERGVTDLGYYVHAKFKDVRQVAAGPQADAVGWSLAAFAKGFGLRQRAILKDLHLLSVADGAGERKRREHEQLSDIVQSRIHHLQNPTADDCGSGAKKLVCNLNKNCGFGCQLHHAAYCLVVAYGTGRKTILLSANWSYAPSGGWQSALQPLSATCPEEDPALASARLWSGEDDAEREEAIFLPIVDIVSRPLAYIPQVIPEDLAPRLLNLHGHPFVWFVGQFMRYLLRPQQSYADRLRTMQKAIGYEKPIVGVHVRRTDKTKTEAVVHSVDEYMEHVDAFYQQLAERQQVSVRRVYLAADDPEVIREAIAKYPSYAFICDTERAKNAGPEQHDRTGDAALFGIIADIHFLSLSDYLVCTFSSQVCRAAYEIMNAMHPDASRWFYSLDEGYYFGGQRIPEQVAVSANIAEHEGEIELQPGDNITFRGDFRTGFVAGENMRTRKAGFYPSFKAKHKHVVVKFPSYPGVNVTHHKWWFETP